MNPGATPHRSPLLERARLAEPLSDQLTAPPQAATTDATWRAIAVRLEAQAKKPAWSSAARHAAWATPLALAAAMLVLWLRPDNGSKANVVDPTASAHLEQTPNQAASAPPQESAPQQAPPDGALLLVDGRSLAASFVPPDAEPRELVLSDGSTLTLGSGTAIEPLAMTARDVVLRLVSGQLNVFVVPDGPRRWLIEAGNLSVEVTGTRFAVQRTTEHVSVSVSQGAVLVRSTELQDGVERLSAGSELTVATPRTPENNPARALPARKQPPDAASLLTTADQARVAGDLAGARRALTTFVHEHPKDPRVGWAQFQLAVLVEQGGESASAVVRAFTTACQRVSSSSLKQDCYFRLYQAQLRAGSPSQARATAQRSLKEFPSGRYHQQLRTAASEPDKQDP